MPDDKPEPRARRSLHCLACGVGAVGWAWTGYKAVQALPGEWCCLGFLLFVPAVGALVLCMRDAWEG
jgi:hypothetical protein